MSVSTAALALCQRHRRKPKATHQSPAAMIARYRCQAGLRAHEYRQSLLMNRLPTSMTQWLSIRRLSFTVAGAAPGLVLAMD
jgi:hypothetical protein